MSEWSMVWLQQKGDDDAIFTPRNAGSNKPLSTQLQRSVSNLQRHTKATEAKVETPWMRRFHAPNYVDQDKYKWSKTPYFEDCKKCMYTDQGSVKKGKKI